MKVSVKDMGPGIPEEDKERIFDKLVQGGNVRKYRKEGIGLGLAIVKEIVESHKGKIWMESKPGEGAQFVFLLPV